MRGRRRVGGAAIAFVAALALSAVLSASGAAAATVSLGQLGSPKATAGGCTSCTSFQPGTEKSSHSYTVPAGNWTITSWSAQAGTAKADVKLRVFRPTGVAGQYRIVADSAMKTLKAAQKGTFPVQIPVVPGDILGLETGPIGTYPLVASSKAGEFFTGVLGFPPVGATVGPGGEFATGGPEEQAGHLNIAATLSSDTASLVVTRTGAGSGTVTSAPAGIDCGSTCSHVFELGTAVSLTAAPAPGSEFAGWSGGGCSGTGGCNLVLNGGTNVSASFLPSNRFQFGKLRRYPSKGTARLALVLPNAGSLSLGGKGVKPVRRKVAKQGTVLLPIAPTRRTRLALAKNGKAKVALAITFVPTGGDRDTVHHRVTLVER